MNHNFYLTFTMETGILAAFSKKVISTIIAVGSMFYSTIDGVIPTMSIADMQFRSETIVVSTTMDNCYTDELDQILASGNEIPIQFSIELFRDGASKPDSTITFYHLLQYSPIDNNFKIYYSERNKYVYSLNMDQAKILFPRVLNHRVISSNEISDNVTYYLKITAWLDKIKLQGMEDELNLIYYWNSIKPQIISPIFSKSNFQS